LSLSSSADHNGSRHERSAIVIVDRYPLSRSCLARILRHEFQEFTILEIENVQQFDSMIGNHISVIALNIGQSAVTDEAVLQDLAYLRRSLSDGPLILITKVDASTISDAMISEITRYGVRGYITDSASVEIALAALRLVIAGGAYFPRAVVSECPNWVPASPENLLDLQPVMIASEIATEVGAIASRSDVAFTERERQVLAMLLRGLPNKVIASELNLSQNTIKSHISRIMHKLHAKNRTEAVVLCRAANNSVESHL
jgi:DNA-binding NarL/FixJ family response regulator